jgi:hypothetical protein
MEMAFLSYRHRSFTFSEGDGDLIEVLLGQTSDGSDIFRSVLFCPFCGTKVPYTRGIH